MATGVCAFLPLLLSWLVGGRAGHNLCCPPGQMRRGSLWHSLTIGNIFDLKKETQNNWHVLWLKGIWFLGDRTWDNCGPVINRHKEPTNKTHYHRWLVSHYQLLPYFCTHGIVLLWRSTITLKLLQFLIIVIKYPSCSWACWNSGPILQVITKAP